MHPSAHPDVVDAAHRRLALLYHPDKDPSPEAHERMKRINEAWAALKDPTARRSYDAKLVLNGNYTAKDQPSNTTGDAEESPARARQSAAPSKDVSQRRVSADELLTQWYTHLSWIRRRFFLPKDFAASVKAIGGDTAVCYKTTVDTLRMRDKVLERDLKHRETSKYSLDLDYRPQTFKRETCKIISKRWEIDCTHCSGRGILRCSICSGRGSVDCPKRKKCPSCAGTSKRNVDCRICLGFGMGCSSCGERGYHIRRCGDCNRGSVPCTDCHGTGSRVCDLCHQSGRLQCKRCDGIGQVVHAVVINRMFSPHREVKVQVSGLAPDQFRNGLEAKHFRRLDGTVEEDSGAEEIPKGSDIVLRRRNVQSYNLLSYQFSYKDKALRLSLIESDKGLKYVTSGLPWTLRLRSS